MKKSLAIFLTLVLLLPMCLVTPADAVETKPFYMVSWSAFKSDLSNVYPMAYFWTDRNTIKEGQTPFVGNDNISQLAENTKNALNNYPDGARYILFTLPMSAFQKLAVDACILDDAIPVIKDWLSQFLKAYKSVGGKLDGLVIDTEFYEASYHSIENNHFPKDSLIYDKIVKNPVYQQRIRPELVKRGFKFYSNPTPQTPEIYSINTKSGEDYAQSRAIWDAVLTEYCNSCVTEGCRVLWDYYPDAFIGDYMHRDAKSWTKNINKYGNAEGAGGNITTAGNAGIEVFHAIKPDPTFFKNSSGPNYPAIVGYNNAVLENTAFSRFLYDANLAKNTYLASDNGRFAWWITHYLGNREDPNSITHTAYYTEQLLHLGMLNPEVYSSCILPEAVTEAADGDVEKYELVLQIINDCLVELTRMVGAADRKPIAVDSTWNHQFVLSGMTAGGKNVWRLTPNTDKVSLKDFKVEGSDPTFSIGGETVTFPQGKIVADGKVREVDTCGYWIETPKDVMPVITRSENHFRENPALGETFEKYKVGTAYNYTNALPEACWEVKTSKGSTATVVADPANAENQMVALKGNYTLNLTKLAKNVTAGDTYAENQAWEISFTVPADMAADAELILLNGSGEKKKSKDGGFKVAGGKVYYSDNGEYKELEGVAIEAGKLYTVVRDMDFSDAKKITCDYYVYDAAGALLGKAKNVPVAAITLPVGTVSYGCANVAGEAVLLDNFKLYATGVAADFELYDEETGMQVTDITQAKAGNVAYRLSWLNGTQKEKSYTVMAEFYNGDAKVSEQVIQEVKMAPGFDGVITGIVENKTEGQTVKVYLRDNNPPEEEEGGNAPSDKNDDNKGNEQQDEAVIDWTLIAIIAGAAVVVIAAVVVVIVVVSKKKKKAAIAAGEGEEVEAVEEAESAQEAEAAPAAEETETTETEE